MANGTAALLDLHDSHTPAAIGHRLRSGPLHSYLRDFIYGAIDGAVTTFAIVCGVEGAGLSHGVVIVLGLANIVADGFSMAVSNFLGTRAEQQQRERARRTEEAHIAHVPEGEREEIRQIFAAKGFADTDLERVVEIITSDRKQWVDTMLKEELGMTLHGPSPWRASLSTFFAFVGVGLLPLIPFLGGFFIGSDAWQPFPGSVCLTAAAFFGIGALKSRFVEQRWYSSGLETLAVGGGAAALAFAVGVLLKAITL